MAKSILTDAEEARLNEIRAKVEYWKTRKDLASKYLPTTNGWYFALIGFEKDSYKFTFTEIDNIYIELRSVNQPPLMQEAAEAIKNGEYFHRIAGYCPVILHELAIYGDSCDYKIASFFSYYICAAYRIKSGACFIVPIASNYPWDAIPAVEESTLEVQMLEDYPNAKIFGQKHTISNEAIKWVDTYFYRLSCLATKHPQIEIAIHAISTFHQQSGLRMVVVSLWAGIEALLGVQSELRYRLSIQIAAFLEEDKSRRIAMFKKIKKMYDDRSKVVHGATIDEKSIVQHVGEAKEILCKILIKIVENNTLLSSDDYDELLLE